MKQSKAKQTRTLFFCPFGKKIITTFFLCFLPISPFPSLLFLPFGLLSLALWGEPQRGKKSGEVGSRESQRATRNDENVSGSSDEKEVGSKTKQNKAKQSKAKQSKAEKRRESQRK